MNFTPNGLSAMGVTLQYLIHDAFGIYDDRLWSGGPAWLNSEKFDIEAKFDPADVRNPTIAQRRVMLQQLLADRFKLIVHRESKEEPVYFLVRSKAGPKFHETVSGNVQHNDFNGAPVCLIPRSNLGMIAFHGCTMHDLVSRLSSNPDVGRTVLDKTGLAGRYDFELRWTSDNTSRARKRPALLHPFLPLSMSNLA